MLISNTRTISSQAFSINLSPSNNHKSPKALVLVCGYVTSNFSLALFVPLFSHTQPYRHTHIKNICIVLNLVGRLSLMSIFFLHLRNLSFPTLQKCTCKSLYFFAVFKHHSSSNKPTVIILLWGMFNSSPPVRCVLARFLFRFLSLYLFFFIWFYNGLKQFCFTSSPHFGALFVFSGLSSKSVSSPWASH